MLQTQCYGGDFSVVPGACPHVCWFLSSFSTLLEEYCVAGEGHLHDTHGTGYKCSKGGKNNWRGERGAGFSLKVVFKSSRPLFHPPEVCCSLLAGFATCPAPFLRCPQGCVPGGQPGPSLLNPRLEATFLHPPPLPPLPIPIYLSRSTQTHISLFHRSSKLPSASSLALGTRYALRQRRAAPTCSLPLLFPFFCVFCLSRLSVWVMFLSPPCPLRAASRGTRGPPA